MAIQLESVDARLKDFYALPGTHLKQYVADTRREADWERATCPRFDPGSHDDNTGTTCRNSDTSVTYTWLEHDCCEVCNDFADRLADRADVKAWLAERAARPPICADRDRLSDPPEYAPEWSKAGNQLLAMMKGKK